MSGKSIKITVAVTNTGLQWLSDHRNRCSSKIYLIIKNLIFLLFHKTGTKNIKQYNLKNNYLKSDHII